MKITSLKLRVGEVEWKIPTAEYDKLPNNIKDLYLSWLKTDPLFGYLELNEEKIQLHPHLYKKAAEKIWKVLVRVADRTELIQIKTDKPLLNALGLSTNAEWVKIFRDKRAAQMEAQFGDKISHAWLMDDVASTIDKIIQSSRVSKDNRVMLPLTCGSIGINGIATLLNSIDDYASYGYAESIGDSRGKKLCAEALTGDAAATAGVICWTAATIAEAIEGAEASSVQVAGICSSIGYGAAGLITTGYYGYKLYREMQLSRIIDSYLNPANGLLEDMRNRLAFLSLMGKISPSLEDRRLFNEDKINVMEFEKRTKKKMEKFKWDAGVVAYNLLLSKEAKTALSIFENFNSPDIEKANALAKQIVTQVRKEISHEKKMTITKMIISLVFVSLAIVSIFIDFYLFLIIAIMALTVDLVFAIYGIVSTYIKVNSINGFVHDLNNANSEEELVGALKEFKENAGKKYNGSEELVQKEFIAKFGKKTWDFCHSSYSDFVKKKAAIQKSIKTHFTISAYLLILHAIWSFFRDIVVWLVEKLNAALKHKTEGNDGYTPVPLEDKGEVPLVSS